MDGRLLDPTSDLFSAVQLPYLSKLASRGVNFVNNYSPSPQCVPSRAAMWTGRRTDQIRAWNNDQGLCGRWKDYYCADLNTTGFYTAMIDPFKEAGWDVEVIGKVDVGGHYGGGFHGTASGLGAWTRAANITLPTRTGPTVDQRNAPTHTEDWKIVEKCKNALSTRKHQIDQPFLLYCGVTNPHPQFVTNSTWLKYVNDSAIYIPKWQNWTDMHPYDQFMSNSKCVLPKDCQGLNATPKQLFEIRQTYYAMCAETDAMFGALYDALSSADLLNQTVVIFTSDHGEMAMSHRQWYKNTMYEGSTRVPLLVSGPGIFSNKQVFNLTSLLDLFPTLLDLTAVPFHPLPDQPLEGFSLAPFLLQPITTNSHLSYSSSKASLPPWFLPTRPDWVLSQYHSNFGNTGSYMIRQGPWKYIYFARPLAVPNNVSYSALLFNLSSDPHEFEDLSWKYPEVVDELHRILLSVLDPDEVDVQVKKQDFDNYLSWVVDGKHQHDQWDLFWKANYLGFNESDISKVNDWIALFNSSLVGFS